MPLSDSDRGLSVQAQPPSKSQSRPPLTRVPATPVSRPSLSLSSHACAGASSTQRTLRIAGAVSMGAETLARAIRPQAMRITAPPRRDFM